LNAWITTDLSTNNLYSWDIETECLIKKLEQPLDEDGKVGEIIDLIGIDILKLLVVATSNKRLHVFNYHKNQIVVNFKNNEFQNGGVYSLVYSSSYKVLLTAGYTK
jgi:WD40 repeat protein